MDNDKKISPPEIRMPQPLQEHSLDPGNEFRVYNIKDHVKVLLLTGQAEVFGRELPIGEPIFFNSSEKLAIFCWKASKIQISGDFEGYASEQTPMHIYVNIQYALNGLRETALKSKSLGPSLLITGA